jgi:hypothetical protein
MNAETVIHALNPFHFHEGFWAEIGKAGVTGAEAFIVMAFIQAVVAAPDGVAVGNCIMGAGLALGALHVLVGFGALKNS